MMDPLGVTPVVVDACKFEHWIDTEVPEYDPIPEDADSRRVSPFPWRDSINKKLVLWSGDLTTLNTEAIVNSTNEAMTDKTPLTERIFRKAGPQLQQEVRQYVKSCKTGEAKVTKGYKLAARYVIHTVGPRYNLKYKTAAESALFNCYRSVFQQVRDYHITSVGIPTLHSLRRGYPNYEGAHIAIRAVRRFLEKYADDMEQVVLVVVNEDEDVYVNLLPLYFPRSKAEEEFSAYHLPQDVGNVDGEPTIPERQIRITAKPNYTMRMPSGEHFEESININEAFETSVAVGAHAFSKMEGDVDKKRKQRLQQIRLGTNVTVALQQRRYDHWLRRARDEDLSAIAALRCFYQSGFDKHQRPVMVFIAKYFNPMTISIEKAAMFFLQLMDQIVNQTYVVVYVHTDAMKENIPDFSYIKEIYNLVDRRYKVNLKAFYILHPTIWSKMNTWFMTTFMLSEMKGKVHNIRGVELLYSRVPPDQLDLPDFVMSYDERVNGTRYYTPEEDAAIGEL